MDTKKVKDNLTTIAESDIKIVINPNHPKEYKQTRFPKSKKKRIRKKWSKNRNYWEWIDRDLVLFNKLERVVYVSKEFFETIKDEFK